MRKKILLKKSVKSSQISNKSLKASNHESTQGKPVNGDAIQFGPSSNDARNFGVDSIINESQKTIAASSNKRGRGRPRKTEGVASQSGQGSPGNSGNFSATGNMLAPVQSQPLIPKAVLVPIVELPFKATASKTEFPGWELSSDESSAIAEQLDVVLRQYLPQTNSPHMPAYVLLGTLTVCTAIRYMAYLDYKKEKVKNAEVKS